jgi:hypothetical protein
MIFSTRLTRQLATVIVVAGVVSTSSILLSYAQWIYNIGEGGRLLAGEDFSAAERTYADAESRFEHLVLPSSLLAAQYRVLVFNRVRVMAATHKYDALSPMLEAAVKRMPSLADDPEYHFWMGNLQYRTAVAQNDKQARKAGLQQAAGSYRLALTLAPDDWDAKFNYQIAMRLLNGMRDKKEDTTEKLKQGGMKILREDTDKAKEQQQKISPAKRG